MPGYKGVHTTKFLLSLFVIVAFAYVMVYAERFYSGEDNININPVFVHETESPLAYVDVRNLEIIDLPDGDGGVLQYIVQPGDTLSEIATKFGTTVTHLKKINNIQSPIYPGQKLIITDEEEGFVYTMKEKMSISVFAEMYNLNKEDLMTLNYIHDDTEILQEGQEIFINISVQEARQRLLLEPEKIVPKPVVAKRPTLTKSARKPSTTRRNNFVLNPYSFASNPESIRFDTNDTIIARWTFNQKISNGFYPGYCTWYAAIISPSIFGPVIDGKQERKFGGNARDWYKNAKAAGFNVGEKPKVGAIAVYSRLRSNAGHVAVVREVHGDKIIVEDMNYLGKFIVTRRREDVDNVDIGYIYP